MDLPAEGRRSTVYGMSREAFLSRLRKGYAIQTGVAFAFLSEGFAVKMPKYSEDETDGFDLKIMDGDEWIEVEVKGRNLNFTGPDDFPYDTVLVTINSRWQLQKDNPPYYVFVSDKTGEAVCLHPNDETVTSKWMIDKQKRVRDKFILAPASELFTMEELFNRLS